MIDDEHAFPAVACLALASCDDFLVARDDLSMTHAPLAARHRYVTTPSYSPCYAPAVWLIPPHVSM